MTHTPASRGQPRLTLVWRRRFVRLLAAASIGLLVTRSVEGLPPLLRHGGAAVCLILAILTLWFLGDAIGPWLAAENDDWAARLRTEAGSRAHSALVWMSAAGWLYLWAREAGSVPLPQVRLDLSELLVGFFLAGLFLPVAIVSWREPEGELTSGPVGLLRSRFSGADAAGHWVGAAMVALCIGLAVLATTPDRVHSPAGRAFLLAAIALIVAAAVAIGWLWLQHDRREERHAGR